MSSLFDLPFDEPEPAAASKSAKDPEVRERRRVVFSVSDITAGIRGLLETEYAEVWVDGSGMPVQTKVVEKNGDSTCIRLTNMEKNADISPEAFSLKLDAGVKIVKG